MLTAGERPFLSNRVDLYDTVKIPVRSEFVLKTGNYESAILLNQIVFSNKEEMTLEDIRRLSLSDRTKQTLRKKLDDLVTQGLITKRQPRRMYNRYLYKAANDVYPNDSNILALIEGLDLREQPCYLTASILNKFRQFALSNREELHISADHLRQMLGTEKSVSLVRLILKRLVAQNYLSEQLVSGVYRYHINIQKLTNIFNPEETERQTEEIISLFLAYVRSGGHEYTKQQKSSWKMTFKRMLMEGYSNIAIKHILAYLGINKGFQEHILTPVSLKRKYEKLYKVAYEKLSKRKSQRFIYKLLNGLVSEYKDEARVPEKVSTPLEPDYWLQAKEFVDSRTITFKRWYFKQSAGVTDIEFDDYVNQALIFAYERFSKGEDNGLNVSGIKYKLMDYMYRKRHSDKCSGRSKEVNSIYNFVEDDISEFADRLDVCGLAGRMGDVEENIEENNHLSGVCEKLLSVLDERTAGIIADYHGLGGCSYTFVEIAKKYQLSSDGYANRLYHKGLEKLRKEAPPDISNILNNF